MRRSPLPVSPSCEATQNVVTSKNLGISPPGFNRLVVRISVCSALLGISIAPAQSQEPGTKQIAAESPADARFAKPRTLNDKYHPWTPPATAAEWKVEADRIRRQLLVSNGLWPLPKRTPLKAVIHGRIEKDDYVIDKVFFASRPGHYVSGLLYRPKNSTGKGPAVLSPHGHWPTGRFYDAGEPAAKQQISQKAETLECAARYPLQARMVQLARMGCVVFHYDMVGYADSTVLDHRNGFADAEASLRLQNMMGIQTWNSIRALDFVESLPDVDPKRIGVTGASGGGTQTFVLCAVDSRPAVAFPAVMVSTAMQGGCVCENADYLRIGINNIAIAALCAPRPMGLSGADDWSIDILTKGYPELQKVYSFFNARDNVEARAWPEFKHNYNSVSRNFMYEWFNKHLRLEVVDLTEREFEPLSTQQAAVFNSQHPLPGDALPVEALRQKLTSEHAEWWNSLAPTDAESAGRYRQTIEPAVHAMLGKVPAAGRVEVKLPPLDIASEVQFVTAKYGSEQVPMAIAIPAASNGTVILWVTGDGTGGMLDQSAAKPKPAVQRLLDSGAVVCSIDALFTGKHRRVTKTETMVDRKFSGYTFGYNRPLLANRVRDILTAVAVFKDNNPGNRIHLVGTDGAGPWVLLASATGMPAKTITIANCDAFQFGNLKDVAAENFLPGAVRYGDLSGFSALIPPRQLVISSTRPKTVFERALAIGNFSGTPIEFKTKSLTDDEIVDRLLEAR